MNGHSRDSVDERLALLDRGIRHRATLAALGYSLGMAGALILYAFFPFPLSRVGSVVLIIALGYMMWKVYEASRGFPEQKDHPLLEEFGKLEAQIRLLESVVYNLPFIVGANLFFMGLPGTGSAESKAWLDCFFLAGTVLVFAVCYLANQQIVRKQLLPLRRELENFIFETGA